ncbi:MAG: hypothetical protein K6E33_08935 [Lachnospiraceae bacterium]|nr:hypothetical protein [Lachnospiraceae bacterium]
MQFGNREKKNVCVGYDLGDDTSQISFYMDGMNEPGTASTITDSEIYEIPTVLAKRDGVNQWYYGNEAVKLSAEPGYTPVDSLLSKACSGDIVEVDGREYSALSLLTLFIKRSLSVLAFFCAYDDITDLMITTASLTGDHVAVFREAAEGLGLSRAVVRYEDHSESFYHYVINRGVDFKKGAVQTFSLSGGGLDICCLSSSANTSPIVVMSDEDRYEGVFPGDGLDAAFLDCLEKGALRENVRHVYLTGSAFSKSGVNNSLRFILDGRKAYEGSNLFSKGAVYSVLDRRKNDLSGSDIIFLGKDKLRANAGIRAMLKGEEVYYPLMDAGVNWYEAETRVTFILTEDSSIPLVITPIDGSKPHVELLPLKNIPDRPQGTFRLDMSLRMTDVYTIEVNVTDAGFGQLYPESGLSWNFTVDTR